MITAMEKALLKLESGKEFHINKRGRVAFGGRTAMTLELLAIDSKWALEDILAGCLPPLAFIVPPSQDRRKLPSLSRLPFHQILYLRRIADRWRDRT